MAPLEPKIEDAGNIPRSKVSEFVEKVAREAKVPFMIGGDHSITAEALKGDWSGILRLSPRLHLFIP
jgi:arginase family enzyme